MARLLLKVSAQSLRFIRLDARPGLQLIRSLKVEDFDEDNNKRVHPETSKFPNEYDVVKPKGKIFDKKPFKISLTEGKRYSWCACGTSKNQPFCDGSHKKLEGTSLKKMSPKFRPLIFTAKETKDFWLCNCKQSGNAPFCDGTHKREDIQAAVKG